MDETRPCPSDLPSLVRLAALNDAQRRLEASTNPPRLIDTVGTPYVSICELCKQRSVLTRVGTNSEFAEVYLIDNKVFKVMPYMYTQTKRDCQQEYILAKTASDASPGLFVNVLEGNECNVVFDPNSKFYERAHVYALFNSDQHGKDKRCRRILEKLASTSTSRTLQEIRTICPTVIFYGTPIESFVISYERMRGDLGQLALVEAINWSKMEESVRSALDVIHKLGIVHNDLHIHNVLVGGNSTNQTFKVADFGRAVWNDAKASTPYMRDYFIISHSLVNFADNHLVSRVAQAEQCRAAGVRLGNQ